MTEEMMSNDVMETEEMESGIHEGEDIMESETKGSKIVTGTLLGLAGVAGLALAAKGAKIAKEKYNTWTIEKLRKKGYVIVEPEVLKDDIIDDEVKEENQTEVKEEETNKKS